MENRTAWRRRKVAMREVRKVREFDKGRFKEKSKIGINGRRITMYEKEWASREEIENEKEYRSNYWFYSILVLLMLAVIGFGVYRNKTYGGVTVKGASMEQTLHDGEALLMMKKLSKVERGDIIIVNVQGYEETKFSDTENIIKRLIAIEGDKVKCEDGVVMLWKAGEDGYERLDEPYAYYSEDMTTYDFAEYTLGEGEIFFLGDNRFNSLDSRYQEGHSHLKDKLYKQEDIIGYVPDWALEWSVENQKLLKILFNPTGFSKNK